MAIDLKYSDLRLGLVDSIIALAEQLGVRRIATRDVRHFAAIRFAEGSAFELVVDPSEPERS
jgi:predicted nucleic acid-binding protein